MLAAVKGASARYRKDMEEENMRKRKAEEEAVVAAEMKKKKEEFDAQKKTWQEKKDEVKAEIKKVEGQIDWANKEAEGAISRGVKATNPKGKDICFKQAAEAQTRIKEKTRELSELQKKLAKLMEKKPREK